jgi:hypothetical protein
MAYKAAATYKEWPFRCAHCGKRWRDLAWSYDLPVNCPDCNLTAHLDYDDHNVSAAVVGDDIPGGIEIRHGVCNDDGSPRRFYSRTELKRALNEKGLTISGDTPRPYNVSWSGRRDEKTERPAPIVGSPDSRGPR